MKFIMKFFMRAIAFILFIAVLIGLSGFIGLSLYNAKMNGVFEPKPKQISPYEMPIKVNEVELYRAPESIGDLKQDSEAVVKGYLLPYKRQEIEYTQTASGPKVARGFNISTLVVVETYQGSLQPGEKIPFIERYYYMDILPEGAAEGDAVNTLVTYNGYMPTPAEAEYIFFLGRQPVDANTYAGYYKLNYLEVSKYPYPDEKQLKKGIENLTNEELGISATIAEEERLAYLEFYKSIINEYIDPNYGVIPPEEPKPEGNNNIIKIAMFAGGAAVALGVSFVGFMVLKKRKSAKGGEGEDSENTPDKKQKKGIKLQFSFKRKDKSEANPDDESNGEKKKFRAKFKLPSLNSKKAKEEKESQENIEIKEAAPAEVSQAVENDKSDI